jgi:hypothetical protein
MLLKLTVFVTNEGNSADSKPSEALQMKQLEWNMRLMEKKMEIIQQSMQLGIPLEVGKEWMRLLDSQF